MTEVCELLWEGLYTLKELYDHGKEDAVLNMVRNCTVDGDYTGEIAMESIGAVFAETYESYDMNWDADVYVFFDPVFDELHALCLAYEQAKSIRPDKNPYRLDVQKAIQSGLYFGDCSYDYWYFDGTQRDKTCKLVLKLYPEYCSYYEIAGGLLDIYDAFCFQIKRLKEEMNMNDTASLPEAA